MKKIILTSKRKLVKLVKFARELAVVTIGVGIALFAGDFLSNRSAKQDLRILLELVKMEIAGNIVISNMTLDIFTQEADFVGFVARNVNNPNIVDSLDYFNDIIGNVQGMAFFTDAFDLLVASGRMHLIRDKELLQQLSRQYRFFVITQTHSMEFAERKQSMLTEITLRPQLYEQILRDFYIKQGLTIQMIEDMSRISLQGFEQILERLKNLRI